MDIGNIGEEVGIGMKIREVVACDHVGINRLVLLGTQNFFCQGPCYIVFEEGLCKVVCPHCLFASTNASRRSPQPS